MVLLHNDAGREDGRVRYPERGDDALAPAFGGTEIDEEDLILVVVNDGGQFGAEPDEVGGIQLAFENGVLEVVAITAHDLKDLSEAFVVAYVVADEVGFSHLGLLAC
jgi:hypothetical protein